MPTTKKPTKAARPSEASTTRQPKAKASTGDAKKSQPSAKTATSAGKGTAAPRADASKAKPAKRSSKSDPAEYTKPELRERIKKEVMAGDKGGRPGQWSARKAQLVAGEYTREGGGYKTGGKKPAQEHLTQWTEEKWQTSSGKKAIHGKTTSRYLPAKAWEKLSPAEKKATDDKKVAVSKSGKQFVANTAAAKKARKQATK